MKTTITLTYNDLEMFLTDEDRQQIEDFPMPSLIQAKMMKKRWNDFFGDNTITNENRESVLNGIIWIKPYLKVYKEFPELWI